MYIMLFLLTLLFFTHPAGGVGLVLQVLQNGLPEDQQAALEVARQQGAVQAATSYAP
jgi:hypothetical protein